jgi:hypothetical protein
VGRADLIVSRVFSRGEEHFVVKDPVGLKYHRLKSAQLRLLELLDSGVTIFDDLGTGPATQFGLVGAVSRVRAAGEQFTGRLVTAQLTRSFGDAWQASARGGTRRVPGLGNDHLIAEAALQWRPADAWRLRVGADRLPLMENLETLRRNIALTGPLTTVTYDSTRVWRFEAQAGYEWLTDDNRRHFTRVEVSPRLSRGSIDIRLLASAEHLAYRSTTSLYFSPRSFLREDVGVQWRQRLGGLQFHGDRDQTVLARYLIGIDDRQMIYHTARVELAYEFAKGVVLAGQGQVIRSSAFNSSSVVLAIRLGGLASPSQ